MNEKILTIVLPTDFSTSSVRAITHLINWVGETPVKYILVNSYEAPHAGATMLVSIDDILSRDSKEEIQELRLQLEQDHPKLKGFIETVSRHGSAHQVVNRTVEEYHADFIAMCTHGASGLKRALAGSNTSSVVRNARVPVYVIPDQDEIAPPAKWAFATDLKQPLSKLSVRLLERLIGIVKGELSVIHVQEPQKAATSTAETDWLTQFDNSSPSKEVVWGDDVLSALDGYVEQNQIGTLVMVKHEHTLLERLFSTTHTEAMTYAAKYPLFIIPE